MKKEPQRYQTVIKRKQKRIKKRATTNVQQGYQMRTQNITKIYHIQKYSSDLHLCPFNHPLSPPPLLSLSRASSLFPAVAVAVAVAALVHGRCNRKMGAWAAIVILTAQSDSLATGLAKRLQSVDWLSRAASTISTSIVPASVTVINAIMPIIIKAKRDQEKGAVALYWGGEGISLDADLVP